MGFTNLLQLAGEFAISDINNKNEDIRHFFLGAVALRADGVIVKARNGSSVLPCPHAHAEARVCRKAGRNSIIFVARIRRDNGEFGMARPCKNCKNKMIRYGIKKCYYTVSSNEYGVISFENRNECVREKNIYKGKSNANKECK